MIKKKSPLRRIADRAEIAVQAFLVLTVLTPLILYKAHKLTKKKAKGGPAKRGR